MKTIIKGKEMTILLWVSAHPVMTFPGSGAPASTLGEMLLSLTAALRIDPFQLDWTLSTVHKFHLNRDGHVSL